jgi:hypothetical protein
MKALVVIFALLGILATVGMGAVFTAVVHEDDGKSDSIKSREREMDEMIKAVKESDEISSQEQKDFVAAVEDLKGALKQLRNVPIPLFASGALGLLLMVLAIANVGPKPLHGVGFLIAGLLPGAWSWLMIAHPLNRGVDLITKYQSKLGSGLEGAPLKASEATLPLLLMVGGAAVTFLLAGLFAFFVKPKAKQPPAGQVPPAGPMPPSGGPYYPPTPPTQPGWPTATP